MTRLSHADIVHAVASKTFLTFGELKMNDRYNGWTNYETWLCVLWMGEDCETEYFEREARRLLDSGDDKDDVIEAIAGEITLSYSERAEEQLGTVGFLSDLLSSALRSVDYREIASHIVDDAE